MNAFVVGPNEGQLLGSMGIRIRIVVTSEQTNGLFSMIEMSAPPGFRAPPTLHRHTDIEWHGHVLEGTVKMTLDGREVTVPAGGLVFVPRGTSFNWWNGSATEPVRWTCTYAPGGFEKYFGDVAAALNALGRPPTPADLGQLAPPLWKKHGIEPVAG
jgi:mannose-6-phosphate isomerase-like protein (cupin superfamily)